MSIPEKLFKYESVSVQSLLNLKTQTVYFASPSVFNDPYDCAIKAQLEEPSAEELEQLRAIFLTKQWPPHVLEKLASTSAEELRPMLMSATREANEKIIDTFIESRGVSCFSEVNDELLMWAHYSDKYTGFCLEFSTDNELFSKAKKVKYVDELPKLNALSTYGMVDRSDVLEKMYCTKSKSWKYEKEWRCIHSQAGTAYTYPRDALTGVYFGPNINRDMIDIVCLILQGQNPTVRFWQGKRSESSFKVEFEEIFYTSALEAEKLGIRT